MFLNWFSENKFDCEELCSEQIKTLYYSGTCTMVMQSFVHVTHVQICVGVATLTSVIIFNVILKLAHAVHTKLSNSLSFPFAFEFCYIVFYLIILIVNIIVT